MIVQKQGNKKKKKNGTKQDKYVQQILVSFNIRMSYDKKRITNEFFEGASERENERTR